ncbi:cysteine protease ATG4B [Anthonomus grandis grandis]|uniref:cysteine protease ATG4B n=1 Tax=Anthonomus grandis grandis TaxID=2921223 RepID=UPI0021658D1D|nr:cysteine protease ATG4B [Anthonomus grandis grandis]
MCNATRDIMFEAVLDAAHDPDDIPQTTEPLWILGKRYTPINETNSIRQDIVSKLWFTYRKDFVAIGGSDGKTTDKGWGCMLRCGQMVLAQALINLHLGRDWLWSPMTKEMTYLNIVKKFEDNRKAPFAIHQIANMGVSEGKQIGQWFGPNTVAQVLKKLVKHDDDVNIAIHVAMDNVVVISEIRHLCISPSAIDYSKTDWKPLLLIIPLRLGLSEINPIYINGLKKCFHFKQSLGVIGGRPNSALYFIGYIGNEVIYFDPHTTQKAGSVGYKDTLEEREVDYSYHCKHALRMNMTSMDPSVAVCFFCKTEADFNDLCEKIKEQLIKPEKQPLFEISFEKPQEWQPNKEDLSALDLSDHSDQDEFEIL